MIKKHRFLYISSLTTVILTTFTVGSFCQIVRSETIVEDNFQVQKLNENEEKKLELTSLPELTLNKEKKPIYIPVIIIGENANSSSSEKINSKNEIQPHTKNMGTNNSSEDINLEKSETIPEIAEADTSTSETTPEIAEADTPTSEIIPENTKVDTPTSETTPENTEADTPTLETTPENTEADTPTLETTPEDAEAEQPAEEPKVLVAELAVNGVEGELKDLIYNVTNTRPGRTTTRSDLQEDVNAIYATGYFQNVKVIPEDTPLGVRITFAVQPNPILENVVIETIPEGKSESILPPEIITNNFSEQYGIILNLRDLQEGIKEINKWYTDNGYDLAQVVGAPQISPDGTVTLIISEGVLADIQVKFYNEDGEAVEGYTRDFIVTREVELKPGDVFNRKTAQQDLQRVFGLGLFKDVRLSFSPGENPSDVIMNVDVEETNTGSLAAGAGISSSSGLFGTASYQEQNLGGNNQTIGTEIQLGERELLFDVSFSDPWIAGDPYRTSYSVNGFRRRSISLVYDGTDSDTIETAKRLDSPRVVRTGGGISFARPIADNPFTDADWVLTAGFQYQHIQIQDGDGETAPRSSQEYGNQRLAFNKNGIDDLFLFRLSASQDTRDNSLRPTNGSLLILGMDQSAPFASNIFFNRLRASYSYYLPIELLNFDFMEGAQTLAFNFQAGSVFGDLPPYEAFVIGGSNSVRGYGEGDLGNGRSYFQATAEYRFPIVSFLAGTLFFDYGTTLGSGDAVIGKPSEVRGLNGSGYGYGLGVRIQSPVGPIRFDYAINDEGDNRFHFGIGEKF